MCSQNISVREMLRILSPNRDAERRTAMAVVQVYGDESYDNKNRIYVVAAYLATDSAWKQLVRRWRRALAPAQRKWGITSFHAADCESGFAESAMPKSERDRLKIDVTDIAAEARLRAFSGVIFVRDYRRVAATDAGSRFLHKNEYFLAFQAAIGAVLDFIKSHSPSKTAAFIFDRQEQFQGRAKVQYDGLRATNPEYERYMGSTYVFRQEDFSAFREAIDNFAYENMKPVLSMHYDPGRKPRIAFGKLVHQLESCRVLNQDGLERLVRKNIEEFQK